MEAKFIQTFHECILDVVENVLGEKATIKTWFFDYDCKCFHYDRGTVHVLCVNLYPTQWKCLMPTGWVDHGYCHCGPPS